MSRLALEEALKKPGRIMTWHAGANSRSHKSSRRQDYITVLPRELVKLTHLVGSTTDVFEFLELFLDELLYEQLHGEDAIDERNASPILLTMQGYFVRFLEFYVKESKPVAGDFSASGTSWLDTKNRQDPRWLILANQNVRRLGDCYESFEQLLEWRNGWRAVTTWSWTWSTRETGFEPCCAAVPKPRERRRICPCSTRHPSPRSRRWRKPRRR